VAQTLRISRVAVGIDVKIADGLVEKNMGYLPWVLGENLAEQIQVHVERGDVGYYPPLDYFRAVPEAVDPALLALTDEVARFCADYTRRELSRRLSRAFSNVAVERDRCTAYSLPRVRPSLPDARRKLARHYAPNVLKIELTVGQIEKEARPNPDPARTAVQKVLRLANDPFESLDLVGSRMLSGA